MGDVASEVCKSVEESTSSSKRRSMIQPGGDVPKDGDHPGPVIGILAQFRLRPSRPNSQCKGKVSDEQRKGLLCGVGTSPDALLQLDRKRPWASTAALSAASIDRERSFLPRE